MSDQAGGPRDVRQRPAVDQQAAVPADPSSRSSGNTVSSVHMGRTRISAVWVALTVAALLLVALVIFIAQNAHTVSIHYLGLDGRLPLAVALLIAAVAGMLLVAIAGTARIVQLRRAVKKSAPRTTKQSGAR